MFDIPIKQNITWADDLTPIATLLLSKQGWYDNAVDKFFVSWHDNVFSLKTASLFGCVVWARILGVDAGLVWKGESDAPTPFGPGRFRANFNHSNFYAKATAAELSVDEMRRLLRMRYYAQTMSPTVVNINYALKDVFGDLGTAYVKPDDDVMKITYLFNFAISDAFKNALINHDILPRGCGVGIELLIVPR